MKQDRWSVKMCDSVIIKSGGALNDKWCYENGVVLKGAEHLWHETKDEMYFNFIKNSIGSFVDDEGKIKTYNMPDYNIDNINSGKLLLFLYNETGELKYKKGVYTLIEQLKSHPRTSEGVFWHKLRYPHQIWLDGIYMASPFYAEFIEKFGADDALEDVAKQVTVTYKKTIDPNTGLLYHGWDESGAQSWANPHNNCSPNFWGRAMGWYLMALVDVLDYLPDSFSRKEEIVNILRDCVKAVIAYQDKNTGLWFQVLDKAETAGNYPEASASCMFVYSILKGIRKGYISKDYETAAIKGYKGIVDRFVSIDNDGLVILNGICKVAGLGRCGEDHPYRDGSFSYYISEPVVANDNKGVGAFIMASVEYENFAGIRG
ncbi:MAG: glycoside hydrolase family 88 protein [Bacillota bacterium]|nr:glycoside hydrolase family 88 protein [Bacillota bacterium]